ncbi:MAG: tetratricopeptide repeat protein, partial [Owenweeksia sp.]
GVADSEKYSREDFLKGVPLAPEEMAASHKLIQEAFIAVGRIYKDDLSDYDAATKALEELLSRYPNLGEKGRIWYTLYRVYTQDKNTARASYYRDLIMTNMADSEYADLIRSEETGVPVADRSEAKKAYVTAYKKYETGAYKESLPLAIQGAKDYVNSSYAPKFQLLRAYNQIMLGRRADFIVSLKLVVDQFSDTEQAEEARSILAQMEEVEEIPGEGQVSENEEENQDLYKPGKNSQHKYIVIMGNNGKVVNDTRIRLTDFNKEFFKIDNLNTKSIFLDMEHQMILVSNFNNSKRAMDYYKTVINQNILKESTKGLDSQHFVISSDNFQKFYKDKDVENYLEFFKENYLKN